MGLRFRKSIKLAPGVKLNLGKKSAGISVGGKYGGMSFNSRSGSRARVSIPGTGISYSTSVSSKKTNFSSPKKRSYKSSSYSRQKDIQKQLRQAEKLEEQKRNALIVEEYENHVKMIKSVHVECADPVDWKLIESASAPFSIGEKGPKEIAAQEEYDTFSPKFIEKLFLKNGEKRKQKLFDAIEIAQQTDTEDYEIWQSNVKLAGGILSGDIDAYYNAIENFNPFEDLLEFGSGFEFGTDSPQYIEIEFQVKSDSVVPHKSKSLTKTGKLSEKALSKTAYYDITQDYVCSCAIRLARELFALLPIEYVIVHATDEILNTATGNMSNETILSVKFPRSKFANINFDKIDASDFIETFGHNMSFKKTVGFKPVGRISYA